MCDSSSACGLKYAGLGVGVGCVLPAVLVNVNVYVCDSTTEVLSLPCLFFESIDGMCLLL